MLQSLNRSGTETDYIFGAQQFRISPFSIPPEKAGRPGLWNVGRLA